MAQSFVTEIIQINNRTTVPRDKMEIRLLFPCIHRVMDSARCGKVIFCGCIFLSKEFTIFLCKFVHVRGAASVSLHGISCEHIKVWETCKVKFQQEQRTANTEHSEEAGGESSLHMLDPSDSALKQSSLQLCRKWDSVHFAHKLFLAAQQVALAHSGAPTVHMSPLFSTK